MPLQKKKTFPDKFTFFSTFNKRGHVQRGSTTTCTISILNGIKGLQHRVMEAITIVVEKMKSGPVILFT